VLFHRLNFQLEVSQVGFQLLDLLGFGQKAALEAIISSAAFTATVASPFLAITLFVHIYSPFDGLTICFRFLRFRLKRSMKPNKYILFPGKPAHGLPVKRHSATVSSCRGFLHGSWSLYSHTASWNSLFLSQNATLTNLIITGTSTSGPITAVNPYPEEIPKTATATAIASSKLLLAAVKESVAVFE
jgi:hypothetical protein